MNYHKDTWKRNFDSNICRHDFIFSVFVTWVYVYFGFLFYIFALGWIHVPYADISHCPTLSSQLASKRKVYE